MNHGITSHGGNREVKDITLYFKKSLDLLQAFFVYILSERTTDCGPVRPEEPPAA